MSKPRRPALDVPITIQILNWEQYLGTKPIKGPRFIMLPMQVRHTKRWTMDGDQFRFFCHLVMLAAFQEEPGKIQGDAYSIARECRCRAESVPKYLQRLIQSQIIQEVTEGDWSGEEEKEEEGTGRRLSPAESGGRPTPARGRLKSAILELPGASIETWKKLFDGMPEGTKRNLGIHDWTFEKAADLAVRNQGTAWKGIQIPGIQADGAEHVVTDDIFAREIEGIFAGETRGHSVFTKSYCRLFMHQPRGLIFLITCIERYGASGGRWDPVAQATKYDDFKKWLYSSWWDFLLDPKTGEAPASIGYTGTHEGIHALQHNIQSQSQIS